MYHADTSHRTITAYQTDSSGVPLRNSTGNLEGKVILRVPESDGESRPPRKLCLLLAYESHKELSGTALKYALK